MPTVTLDLPDDLDRDLRKLADREYLSAEEALVDLLRRRLLIDAMREARPAMEAAARAAGYTCEDDILRDIP